MFLFFFSFLICKHPRHVRMMMKVSRIYRRLVSFVLSLTSTSTTFFSLDFMPDVVLLLFLSSFCWNQCKITRATLGPFFLSPSALFSSVISLSEKHIFKLAFSFFILTKRKRKYLWISNFVDMFNGWVHRRVFTSRSRERKTEKTTSLYIDQTHA